MGVSNTVSREPYQNRHYSNIFISALKFLINPKNATKTVTNKTMSGCCRSPELTETQRGSVSIPSTLQCGEDAAAQLPARRSAQVLTQQCYFQIAAASRASSRRCLMQIQLGSIWISGVERTAERSGLYHKRSLVTFSVLTHSNIQELIMLARSSKRGTVKSQF